MKLTSKIIVLLCLFLGHFSHVLAEESNKHFPHPDRIRYDGSCMTIDGKDVFIYSAAFHYFAVLNLYGETASRKLKKQDLTQ